MKSKADYKLKLKDDLSKVNGEIGMLIARIDKILGELNEIENAFFAQQSSTQGQLHEADMSEDEIWDLIWDSVWSAVKELEGHQATELQQDYKELVSALQKRQSAAFVLRDFKKSGTEFFNLVWNEVWDAVWGVIVKADRKAATELKMIGVELEAWEVKRSALRAELHNLLTSGDEFWNAVKEVTGAMVE